MKRFRIIISAVIILFLFGCADQDAQIPETTGEKTEASAGTSIKPEYNIIGEYICQGEIYDQFKEEAYEYIPSINFYEDGSCRLRVYYIGGVSNVEGVYYIDENRIYVKVDLLYTNFQDSVTGENYMDDEYVFTIIDEDYLVIDRGFYVVNAEDPFVRISTEPDRSIEPTYDMLGKYVCSSEYYNEEYMAEHPEAVTFLSLLKENRCTLYVDYLNGRRKIGGKYKIEGDKIYIYELAFLFEGDEDFVRDNMDDEYVFTIIDEDHLVIDKGYFAVQAGDSFVKVPQGDC